jgi:hypothetical protein
MPVSMLASAMYDPNGGYLTRGSEIDFYNYMSIYNGLKVFETYNWALNKVTYVNAPDSCTVTLTLTTTKMVFMCLNVVSQTASKAYLNSLMLDLGYKNFSISSVMVGADLKMSIVFKPIKPS